MEMNDDACYRAIAARDRRFDGHLFVAVTTTGVYCRPFCPAPTPQRQNVRFFPTAAAAQEAGFRPCLRCRPEISPEFAVVWRGSANTVSRALALIEAGALDNAAGVDALGERLGVGGSQLRRLFRRHLGASPVSVAQTRRVLLAKQLIQDTRLPMVEVAAAAGFGSVRRFNETFQRLYDRPPGALRRAGTAEMPAAAAGAVAVRLGYKPPYDWDFTVSVLRARAVPGVEVVSDGRYARTIAMGGVVVVEPVMGNCLRATVSVPDLRVLPSVVARVRRVFDLAADPTAIGAHLGRDPLLAPLVAVRPGLRAPGAWDGFEYAVCAILGRHAGTEAGRLAGRLATHFGEEIEDSFVGDQGLTHIFPTPRRLAKVDLAAAGVSGAAEAELASFATVAAAEPLILSPRASIEDAVARLRALAGMAEQAARHVAACVQNEPDAFPDSDLGPACAALADASSDRPSPATLRARAEGWRPWRAHAVLHLQAARLRPASCPEEVTGDQRTA